MALSTIANAKVPFDQNGHLGVMLVGTDLYWICEDTGTADKVGCFKSTDGGLNWTRQDTGNAPIMANNLYSLASVLDGTTIHIIGADDRRVVGMGFGQIFEYYTFNTSTDLWVIDEQITDTDINDVVHGVDIAVRSDGDVIVVHQISDRTNMGSDFRQFGYSRREGGTWTTEVPFNEADEIQQGATCVMAPNDECHIGYVVTAALTGYVLTLDSGNSLSTRVSAFTAGNPTRFFRPVTFDISGTQKVLYPSRSGRVRRLEEDGSGDMALESGQGEVLPFSSGGVPNSVAYDTVDADAHFFGGGLGSDLFRSESPLADDASWTAQVEQEDNVSMAQIWIEYHARDGGRQIGYVIEDGVTMKYSEFFIAGGPLLETVNESVGVTDSTTSDTKLDEFTTTRPSYWKFGVHRKTNGDVYTATAQAGSDQHRRLDIWKSVDDGVSWEMLHTFTPVTGTYSESGAPFTICMGLLDNDILHIFWNPDEVTRDKELQYCAWDTGDDTVEHAPEIAYAVGVIGRTIGSGNVGIRSTGELVCAFREDPDDGDGELTMIRGTQGSWTIHDGVSDGDGISAGSWAIGLAVADNNDVHVTWSGSFLIHRVLRANNTLSTIDTANAVAVSIVTGPGFSEIFDGKLFYSRLSTDGSNNVPTATDGTVAEDISFTNRFLDLDQPDRNGAVVGVSMAQAGGRLIIGWVQEDTQEAVWLEYNPSTDLWGTTPQGTGVTVTENADVVFDAWVRGGNVYVVVLENPDATNDDDMGRIVTEDLVGTEVTGGAKFETVTDDTDPTDLITRVHDAERTPIDAVGVTDATTRVLDVERAPVDPVEVTDSATPVKSITVALSESVGVTDVATPLKTIASIIIETLGVTDSTTRIAPAIRSVVEGIAIADATSNDETNRETLTEPIGVTELVTRTAPAIRSVVEPIGVTDDATPIKTIQVSITEDIGVIDSTVRIHPAKRTPIEVVGVTDLIASAKVITPEITEVLGVTDSTPFVLQISIEISEAMGVTDLTTRIAPAIRAIAEAMAVSDVISDSETNRETSIEPVGVTDLIARLAPAIRSVVEALGVTDLISSIKSITVAISESVGVTDVVSPAKTVITEISESVGVTDAATPVKTITVSISETLGVTDSTTPIKSITIVIAEALGVTDSTPFSIEGGLTEAVVDPIGVIDSTTRVHDAVRSVVEAIGVTDTTASVKTITVAITETVGVTDATPFTLQIAVTISNGVGVTDSTTRVAPAVRIIAEGVAVQDVISDSETNRETVTEPISVTDLIARVHTAFRTITDDADVTDLITAIKTIQIEISEALGLTDLISSAKTVPVGITDLMGVTDSTTAAKTIQVSISESVGVADSTFDSLSGATLRSVVDPIGVTDSTTRTWTIVRTITESVGVTDLTIKGEVNEEVVVETLGVTDVALPAKTSVRSVTETAGVTDSIEVVLSITREISESTEVVDDTSRVAVAARALIENVGVTTVLDRTADWVRILADNVNVTEAVLAIDQAPSSLVPLGTVLSDEPVADVASNVPADITGDEF